MVVVEIKNGKWLKRSNATFLTLTQNSQNNNTSMSYFTRCV